MLIGPYFSPIPWVNFCTNQYKPKIRPCFSKSLVSSPVVVISEAKFATKTRAFTYFGSLLITGLVGELDRLPSFEVLRPRDDLDLDVDRDRERELERLLLSHGLS